jgi:hypothetical protein
MLDRINQSKTCLKMLEIEEEISLSEETYLTESKWKTIPYLLTAAVIQRGTEEA